MWITGREGKSEGRIKKGGKGKIIEKERDGGEGKGNIMREGEVKK